METREKEQSLTQVVLTTFSLLTIVSIIIVGPATLAFGEPSCADSDGGLNYDTAGCVEGIGPNGWPFLKCDTCETNDYEGYIKEFFCNGTTPWPKRYRCPDGCLDGACISDEISCNDWDGDGFAVEGGECGLRDCDDTNALIHPSATEVCDNSFDDDCNNLIDLEDPACVTCTDMDEDGYALEGGLCGEVDCDDYALEVNPGVIEVCDNFIDDDCDGQTDVDDPQCSGLNIVLIGWDGVQRDHLWECYNRELPECSGGLPNMQELSGGVIFDNTTTSGGTATKPGWAQILTGYNAEVTGVFSNGDYQPIPEGYTIFEKIENHFGADNVVTMVVSGKSVNTGGACIGEPTYDLGEPAIEDKGEPYCITKEHLDYYDNDLRQGINVANRALQLLELHQNDRFFAFFLFRDPDVGGHLTGENSAYYSQGIIENDQWLGVIVSKLRELGIYQKTLIYVTTDHGFDEASDRHGNAPFGFFASNDPWIVRSGDRKDIAPTILQRYGISLGAIGEAPAVDGYPLYAIPQMSCVPEGKAYVDYPGAPTCCPGLQLIGLDARSGPNCIPATGGTGDNSGYCTNCGNGFCEPPENWCNCPEDCL
jgi:hypothetical protein